MTIERWEEDKTRTSNGALSYPGLVDQVEEIFNSGEKVKATPPPGMRPERFIDKLMTYLRIKGVSADQQPHTDKKGNVEYFVISQESDTEPR